MNPLARLALSLVAERAGLPAKFLQYAAARGVEGTLAAPRRERPGALRARIAREAPALDAALATIDPEGRQGSIAAVHAGTLKCGTRVAVKILHPGLGRALDRQLRYLIAAAARSPARAHGFDTASYGSYLEGVLASEISLVAEVERTAWAHERAREWGLALRVPRPYPTLGSASILVTDWLPLRTFADGTVARGPGAARALEAVASFAFRALLVEGRLYSDLNPGNIGVLDDRGNTPALVDFGVLEELPAYAPGPLLALVDACERRAPLPVLDALVALGFDAARLSPLSARLPAVCREILAPLLSERPCRGEEFSPGPAVRALLGEDAWTFRMAAPAWFFGVTRFVGFLFAAARRAEAPMLFREPLHGALTLAATRGRFPAWSPPTLPTTSTPPVDPARRNAIAGQGTAAGFDLLPSALCVELRRDGKDVVRVRLPISAARNLPALVGDDVRAAIAREGSSLEDLRDRVLAGAAARGEILRRTVSRGELVVTLE